MLYEHCLPFQACYAAQVGAVSAYNERIELQNVGRLVKVDDQFGAQRGQFVLLGLHGRPRFESDELARIDRHSKLADDTAAPAAPAAPPPPTPTEALLMEIRDALKK